jgi:hypothetical protein
MVNPEHNLDYLLIEIQEKLNSRFVNFRMFQYLSLHGKFVCILHERHFGIMNPELKRQKNESVLNVTTSSKKKMLHLLLHYYFMARRSQVQI